MYFISHNSWTIKSFKNISYFGGIKHRQNFINSKLNFIINLISFISKYLNLPISFYTPKQEIKVNPLKQLHTPPTPPPTSTPPNPAPTIKTTTNFTTHPHPITHPPPTPPPPTPQLNTNTIPPTTPTPPYHPPTHHTTISTPPTTHPWRSGALMPGSPCSSSYVLPLALPGLSSPYGS